MQTKDGQSILVVGNELARLDWIRKSDLRGNSHGLPAIFPATHPHSGGQLPLSESPARPPIASAALRNDRTKAVRT